MENAAITLESLAALAAGLRADLYPRRNSAGSQDNPHLLVLPPLAAEVAEKLGYVEGQVIPLPSGWHRLVFSRYLPEPDKVVRIPAAEPFWRGLCRRRERR